MQPANPPESAAPVLAQDPGDRRRRWIRPELRLRARLMVRPRGQAA